MIIAFLLLNLASVAAEPKVQAPAPAPVLVPVDPNAPADLVGGPKATAPQPFS